MQIDMFSTEEKKARLHGKANGELGKLRATTKANRLSPGWSETAFNHAVDFINSKRMGEDFLGEDIRTYAESQGLITPSSNRAWGGVVSRLAKRKLIERIGYRSVKNPNANGANASVWVRA